MCIFHVLSMFFVGAATISFISGNFKFGIICIAIIIAINLIGIIITHIRQKNSANYDDVMAKIEEIKKLNSSDDNNNDN